MSPISIGSFRRGILFPDITRACLEPIHRPPGVLGNKLIFGTCELLETRQQLDGLDICGNDAGVANKPSPARARNRGPGKVCRKSLIGLNCKNL